MAPLAYLRNPCADALGHRAGPARAEQVERRQRVVGVIVVETAAPASEHDAADGRKVAVSNASRKRVSSSLPMYAGVPNACGPGV